MGRSGKEFKGDEAYVRQDKWWQSLKKAIDGARSVKPSRVIGQDDWRTSYYRNQLRMIIKTIMEIEVSEEFKDKWDFDYFKDVLLFDGRICVFKSRAGLIALRCGLFGQNVYERSHGVRVDNPIIGNYELTIGKDCEVIFLMDDLWCHTFEPIVEIYACKLAMCDSSIDVNLLNSKVAFIVDCSGKKQADEAKMIFDKINSGEPAVFYENDGINIGTTMQFFKNDVKGSFVVDMLQDAKRAIMNEFLTTIGVNNSAVEKKERLITDEVNGNNMEVQCNMKYVKEMVEYYVERVNRMFPELNLKITFPFFEAAVEDMEEDLYDDDDRSLVGRKDADRNEHN